MKNAKKMIALVLCAILLVVGSVMGTLAYLTSNAKVENTFTVGHVTITLDEAPVNEYGVEIEGDRRDSNMYKLIPGHTYTKDPTVHVDATSEDCYVFVKITSNIDSFIDVTEIQDQLEANGWLELKTGIWYQKYTKGQSDKELKVFESFTVLTNANSVTGWSDIASAASKITVDAYAVQSETFADAEAAWNATFGA